MPLPGLAITSGLRSMPVGATITIPYAYTVQTGLGPVTLDQNWPSINMALRRESDGSWLSKRLVRAGAQRQPKRFTVTRATDGVIVTRQA